MSWPRFFNVANGPDASVIGSLGSFVYSSQFQQPNGSRFIFPKESCWRERLYNITKGYNSRVLIPEDKRFPFEVSANLRYSDTMFSQISHDDVERQHFESQLLQDSSLSFDPLIADLMDIGFAQDNSVRTSNNKVNIISYVIGNERTNLATSVLKSCIVEVDQATNTNFNKCNSRSELDILEPGASYLYHTKTPISQVSYEKHKTPDGTASFVLLVREIDKVNILYPTYNAKTSSIKLTTLYSFKISPRQNKLNFHFTENISYTSLHPSEPTLAVIESKGALSIYNIPLDPESPYYMKTTRKVMDRFCYGQGHSNWHRVYWTDNGSTLLVANRHAINTFNVKEEKYSPMDSFVNSNHLHIVDIFSGLIRSPISDHEFFVMFGTKLLWIDSRDILKPLLSISHVLTPNDPSSKIDVVAAEDGNSVYITVSTEMNHIAAVYCLGRNDLGLPVSLQDPYYYTLNPEFVNKTLRTIRTFSNSYNQLPLDSEITTTNLRSFESFSVFQHSRNFGLAQHVLTSDATQKLNLALMKPPKTIQKLVTLTRGYGNTTNLDDWASSSKHIVTDLRPVARLLIDKSNESKDIETNDALYNSIKLLKHKVKLILNRKDRGVYSLLDFLRVSKRYSISLSEIDTLIESLKDITQGTIAIQSRNHKLRSFLYDAESHNPLELKEFFTRLWIEPLKGYQPPKKVIRTFRKFPIRRNHKKGGYFVYKRKNIDLRVINKPFNPKPEETKILRRIKFSKAGLNKKIKIRSIDYKRPPFYYNPSFISKREKILERAVSDLTLANITLTSIKETKNKIFHGEDIGVLRQYTSAFDKVDLSIETQNILSLWRVNEGYEEKQRRERKEKREKRTTRVSFQSSKKRSSMLPGSFMSQSQVSGSSQGFSQTQDYMASQDLAGSRRKKKKKLSEGF